MEKRRVFRALEDNKTVANESTKDDGLKMSRKVFHPFLFMITEKYIIEGRPKRREPMDISSVCWYSSPSKRNMELSVASSRSDENCCWLRPWT